MQEPDRRFSVERAEALAGRIEQLLTSGARVGDWESLKRAHDRLPAFRKKLSGFMSGGLSADETKVLVLQETELENLEGRALKGPRRTAEYRPAWPEALPEGLDPRASHQVNPSPDGTTTKINTGWILDQHVFDPDSPKQFPTLYSDCKRYDEGQNDMAMGHSDHPSPTTEFGWVWQVQSFYWTDTTTVTDHANASYCLFVMVSPDGGFTWWLYAILYDPTSVSHTTSLDMVNPKMAIDVTAAYDRFFIAYEYVYSSTDHDVYVYSETSVLDQPASPPPTANPRDVGIGVSTNMERNAAIASDYKTTDTTSYLVVAYEYAYSATDYDIHAAQSNGDGSIWTTPVSVAATAGMETHPALTAGSSGGTLFTAYMHLAYNYDTYAASSQLLLNPGFELGDNGNWTVRVTGDINGSGLNTHTGTWKAWLGGTLSQPNDWIYQQVAIPFNAQSAPFSFWLKIVSAETVVAPHDFFNAEVRDSAGNLLQTLVILSDADKTAYASYVQLQFDLSQYRGQTVRVHFWASNDATNTTSFYVDDAALNVATSTASEVRYAKAAHPAGTPPGTTPYPTALSSFVKLTVLANTGGTTAWPYGPPAIAATHGGSTTVTGGRLLVAADQFFPLDQPTAGDPSRYQLIFAMNMCNGSTTCGAITPACTPALTYNWNAYYFYDKAGDSRFPSLVVDGIGWVQGTSTIPQNGVASHPGIYMAYYHRIQAATSAFGNVEMLAAFADDETCTGFQAGAWYYFTAQSRATDDDEKVVAKPGTLAAFNYFDGWPGVCFNKRLNHPGANVNDDVYFTTLGDNYMIDTTAAGTHIDGYWTFNALSYAGTWTYAWPAGIEWVLTADASAIDTGRYYTFSTWSTGDASLATTILSDFCGVSPPCPTTTINAQYGGGCLTTLPETTGLTAALQGTKVDLAWTGIGQPGDAGSYTIYRATDPTSASNFAALGSSAGTNYSDSTASGPLYFYLVTAGCGPYEGPWGAYGQ